MGVRGVGGSKNGIVCSLAISRFSFLSQCVSCVFSVVRLAASIFCVHHTINLWFPQKVMKVGRVFWEFVLFGSHAPLRTLRGSQHCCKKGLVAVEGHRIILRKHVGTIRGKCGVGKNAVGAPGLQQQHQRHRNKLCHEAKESKSSWMPPLELSIMRNDAQEGFEADAEGTHGGHPKQDFHCVWKQTHQQTRIKK